jgi:hypothetical protein
MTSRSRAGAGVPERVHQPAGLDQVAARLLDDLAVADPRADRPLQDVGVFVLVDVRQDEPPGFDRVLHDVERTSGIRPGDLEDHPHAAEPDRTAFARLHDDRRCVHDNMKGLKLLQRWIGTAYCLDAPLVMRPFFVLYDFRIVMAHLIAADSSESMLASCYERMSIPEAKRDFESLYDALVGELIRSYEQLLGASLGGTTPG